MLCFEWKKIYAQQIKLQTNQSILKSKENSGTTLRHFPQTPNTRNG